jgi:perosamine synthetase
VDWLETVRVIGFGTEQRNALVDRMAADGVETRPVFYPLHVMPPYADGKSYPGAELVGAEGISLPTHTLLSDDDVRTVCATFARHVADLRG